MLRILSGAAALAVLLLASGCGWVPRIPGITPYKIDIQQGNYVSQEMVSQLKPGMSKDQLRALLGTPLLTDIFHSERWDYVWWRQEPNGRRESRRLVVYFAENRLQRVGGDPMPAAPVAR